MPAIECTIAKCSSALCNNWAGCNEKDKLKLEDVNKEIAFMEDRRTKAIARFGSGELKPNDREVIVLMDAQLSNLNARKKEFETQSRDVPKAAPVQPASSGVKVAPKAAPVAVEKKPVIKRGKPTR